MESKIEFYEIEDGDKFCICQYEDDEMTDQILMTRDVAISLAHEILQMLS